MAIIGRDTALLARRFIIVCLIATALAFALINLIERSSGPAYSWKVQTTVPCVFERPQVCAIPSRQGAGQ